MRPTGKFNKLVPYVNTWPSWLVKGYPNVVNFFLQFFYLSDLTDFERAPGHCPHCQKQITGTYWEHVFHECRSLHTISPDAQWHAFCRLCYGGDSGLAIYACFPLFFKYHKLVLG